VSSLSQNRPSQLVAPAAGVGIAAVSEPMREATGVMWLA
jgi:hypothetical protein